MLVSQRQARERLPLLAPLIAETQPSVDDVIAARHLAWPKAEQDRRDRAAAGWRAQRARLATIPQPARSALRAYWDGHRWLPGDPGYLGSTITAWERGDLLLIDGRIVSRHEIEHQASLDAKLRAQDDRELDHTIQTHWSLKIVELARAERRRRSEGQR